MSDRDHIPNELRRQLMLEVGYRCPLCKQTESLQIEHIEEWSEVRRHEFANMIVLCANCHGRKKRDSDPRHINRASLKRLKQTRGLLNGRYSELERRMLEVFQRFVVANPGITEPPPLQILPDTMHLLVMRLEEDGFIVFQFVNLGISHGIGGFTYEQRIMLCVLTPAGREFIDNLIAATNLDG